MEPIVKPKIDKLTVDVKRALREGSMTLYDLQQNMGNIINEASDWVNENGAILAENEEEREKRFQQYVEGTVVDGSVSMAKLEEGLRGDIEKLLANTFPLVLTATISPTAMQKKGSGSVIVNLIWSGTVDGKAATLSNVKVNNVAVSGSSYNTTVSDTTSFKIEAEAQGRKASITKSVTFVYPIYIFFNASDTMDGTTLSGEQSLATSLNISKNFSNGTGADAYLWIVSGYTPKTVQTTGGLTIDVKGSVIGTKNNLTYWRSSDKLSSGSWGLSIKS